MDDLIEVIEKDLNDFPIGHTECFSIAGTAIKEAANKFIVDDNGASNEFDNAHDAAVRIAQIIDSDDQE